MFDKLIESNSEGAEFKNRRSYFMVSSIVVGLLFLAAVVASIYAGDIGLGQDEFELSTMIAPPVMPDTQPEPEPPRQQTHETQQVSEVPTRQTNMSRPDEEQFVPNGVSVVQNTEMSRPPGLVKIGLADSDPAPGFNSGRGTGGNGDPIGTGLSNGSTIAENRGVPAPPPIKPDLPKRPISIGVANGKAVSLPKPPYPPPAAALNIQGKVDVQVTIDETGNVIASKAVSGHPLLKGAAEKAAWSAKFTPTLLSNVPVKVTGVIVYNFTRN